MRRFPVVLWLLIIVASVGGTILATVGQYVEPYDACIARQQSQSTRSRDYGWTIDAYKTTMQLQPNGSIHVTEEIDALFEVEKHGIYRYIPLAFEPKGDGFKTTFSNIQITDVRVTQDGSSAQYTTGYRSSEQCVHGFLAQEYNRELMLKIGDPEHTIQGTHQYRIEYVMHGALRNDRDNVELYWNAIGQNWGVPINSATILVKGASDGSTQLAENVFCYVGVYGTQGDGRCISQFKENTVELTASSLEPYEGVTFLAEVQSTDLSRIQNNIGGTLEATRSYLLARWFVVLGFVPLGYFAYTWYRKGRDPVSRGIVAPRYDAPGDISPAKSGLIVDQSVDSVDVASIVMSIAQKGYMRIYQEEGTFGIGKKYRFEKLTPAQAKPLSSEEKLMYEGIFMHGNSVWLSALKEKFSGTILSIKNDLYNWASVGGLLSDRPSAFHGQFLLGYVLIAAAFAIGFIWGSPATILLSILSTAGSIPFVLLYKYYTVKGKEMQEELLGLKMYMGTAEKDRIEFHNAPEKTPALFERLLPYAMALGVVKIWADKFRDLEMQPPDWYVGNYHTFNPYIFAQDLSSAGSSFNSTMTSVKSSSGGSGFGGGGGFSGGGGGGGGGGSW